MEHTILKKILKEISEIPATSYLSRPITKYIYSVIGGWGIPDCIITHDAFGVYIKLKRGKPMPRVIIMSHLDHPGFVLNSDGTGIPFGDIGNHLIKQKLEKGPLPIRIYRPNGSYQGIGHIIGYSKSKNPRVIIKSDFPIQINSFGQFDVERFREDNGVVYMYHADNNALSAIALDTLYSLREAKDINLELYLTYNEEVRQLGSIGVAQNGVTPFGPITFDTRVLNLEITSFLESETGKDHEIIRARESAKKFGLSQLNYSDGCILRVNDTYATYGALFPNYENELELITREILDTNNIKFQSGIAAGISDAQSFSFYQLTPNIVTLCMQSRYRHNWSDDNNLVPEQFVMMDAIEIAEISQKIVLYSGVPDVSRQSTARLLKREKYGTDPIIIGIERKKRKRIVCAMLPRLRKGYYFPETLIDKIIFPLYQLLAKILY